MRTKAPRLAVVEETQRVTCNGCGTARDCYEFVVYASDDPAVYPSETIEFDLCGQCLCAVVAGFGVPPTTVRRETEVLATHSETGETYRVFAHYALTKEQQIPWGEVLVIGGVDGPSPGIYLHHKGNLYECIRSVFTVDRQPLVLYRALYGESKHFLRPLAMWNAAVGGQPRFQRVAP